MYIPPPPPNFRMNQPGNIYVRNLQIVRLHVIRPNMLVRVGDCGTTADVTPHGLDTHYRSI